MIPTAVLPHKVTIEPVEGTAGVGTAVYGRPLRVRGEMRRKRRSVKGPTGAKITSTASCVIRPNDRVTALSRLTHRDRTYTVIDIDEIDAGQRSHHVELILEGPR